MFQVKIVYKNGDTDQMLHVSEIDYNSDGQSTAKSITFESPYLQHGLTIKLRVIKEFVAKPMIKPTQKQPSMNYGPTKLWTKYVTKKEKR